MRVVLKRLPERMSPRRVVRFVEAQVEVEHLLPYGGEVDDVGLLSKVLLRDLELDGGRVAAQVAEEREDGHLDLEVDGAVLDLDDDVGLEPAVELVEEVDSGVGAVCFPVERLVEVAVVV